MADPKNILLLYLLIFISLSCNKEAGYDYDQPYRLTPSKKIKIKIGYETRYSSNMMSIVEDTLLAYENRERNRIQLYDIKNETLFSNIPFARNGDNGIGGIAGFYVKNLDSIYLIGDHRKEIALANADGLVLNRYKFFNQYRKVFYRFVSHPIDYIDPGTGQERTIMDKPTSIIVLDQDLKVLGETMLEKNKYLVGEGDFFVNSEGLWVSNNHKNNPELDEDFLSFTLLSLSAE